MKNDILFKKYYDCLKKSKLEYQSNYHGKTGNKFTVSAMVLWDFIQSCRLSKKYYSWYFKKYGRRFQVHKIGGCYAAKIWHK